MNEETQGETTAVRVSKQWELTTGLWGLLRTFCIGVRSWILSSSTLDLEILSLLTA
jgi:hypothetical protein